MLFRADTEAFSTTNAVHMESCSSVVRTQAVMHVVLHNMLTQHIEEFYRCNQALPFLDCGPVYKAINHKIFYYCWACLVNAMKLHLVETLSPTEVYLIYHSSLDHR